MRVLVVASDVLLPGAEGGATHVTELVGQLAKRGPVLGIVRSGSEGDHLYAVAPRPRRRGVTRFVNAVTFLRAAQRVREFRPDVVYERASSLGLGTLLSRALGVPLVLELLDGRFSESSLRAARAVTATDLDIIPEYHRSKGYKVHWGVNDELFVPRPASGELRRQLGIAADAKLAVYVGSFCRWHGLLDLVDVARQCAEDIHFLLVGDGESRAECSALVRQRGLSARFHMPGAVSYRRVPDYLAASDLALAPLRPELHDPTRPHALGMDPLKIFEYLAMGLPTVATRSANLERLFGSGEVVFAERGSPASLASAITRVLADENECARLARLGVASAARYTWRAHVDQLCDIFRQVGGASSEPKRSILARRPTGDGERSLRGSLRRQ